MTPTPKPTAEKERHFPKDCPFKKAWLDNAQSSARMFNADEDQICRNCIPRKEWHDLLSEQKPCENCNGKGYNTRCYDEIASDDFGGEGYVKRGQIEKVPCPKCQKPEQKPDSVSECNCSCHDDGNCGKCGCHIVDEVLPEKIKKLEEDLRIAREALGLINDEQLAPFTALKFARQALDRLSKKQND